MSELIKVSGLWEKKDKGGNMLLSGSLGSLDILVMKNRYKDKDTQPDYKLLIKKKEAKIQTEALDDGIDLMDKPKGKVVEDYDVIGEEEIVF